MTVDLRVLQENNPNHCLRNAEGLPSGRPAAWAGMASSSVAIAVQVCSVLSL